MIAYVTSKLSASLYAGALILEVISGLGLWESVPLIIIATAIYTLAGGLTVRFEGVCETSALRVIFLPSMQKISAFLLQSLSVHKVLGICFYFHWLHILFDPSFKRFTAQLLTHFVQLKAVMVTDSIQMLIFLVGGLAGSIKALELVGGISGLFKILRDHDLDYMTHMIHPPDDKSYPWYAKIFVECLEQRVCESLDTWLET